MKVVQGIIVRCYSTTGAVPNYETSGASGFDLKSSEDTYVPAKSTAVISTGFYVEIPNGYEIQVRSRSGLAAKKGVMVLNSPGTIDSDYRNEIKVILFNTSDEDFVISVGDRIAQGVLCPVLTAHFEVVPSPSDLSETVRGLGGLGHTGV